MFFAMVSVEDGVETIVADSRDDLLRKFRRLYTPDLDPVTAVVGGCEVITGGYWDGTDVPDDVFLCEFRSWDEFEGKEVHVTVGSVIEYTLPN